MLVVPSAQTGVVKHCKVIAHEPGTVISWHARTGLRQRSAKGVTRLATRRNCRRPKSDKTHTLSQMTTASTAGREAVESFQNSAGEKLVATFLDAGSAETVVLCHGYADTRNGFHLPALANKLAEKGYSSLRFDFTGNGDSEGPFRYGNYNSEAEDVRSAVKWLQSRGKAVRAILGHSKGGDTVLTYAGKYDDVARVVNVSGRFFLGKGITPRFGEDIFDRLKKEKTIQVKDATIPGDRDSWTLTEEDMTERLNHDMEKISNSIQNSSVLTIHGGADKTIPFADAHEFDKNIAKHQLHVIEGASHNYDKPEHAEQLLQLSVDFMTAE